MREEAMPDSLDSENTMMEKFAGADDDGSDGRDDATAADDDDCVGDFSDNGALVMSTTWGQ